MMHPKVKAARVAELKAKIAHLDAELAVLDDIRRERSILSGHPNIVPAAHVATTLDSGAFVPHAFE